MSKRALEETSATTDGYKKPKMDEAGVLETRVLISNYDASVIIGKGGSNVKAIRQTSSAFISILKNKEGASTKERVMNVKGTVENSATAIYEITKLLLENETKESKGQSLDCSIKLLVHKFLSGAIIGKGGSIIKEVQSDTGARIQISNEVLGQSTEKTVTISGSPQSIRAASIRVLTQMRDNPLKPGTLSNPYSPGYAAPSFGLGMTLGGREPGPSMYGRPTLPSFAQSLYNPYKMDGLFGLSAGQGRVKTEKIVIPSVCAGSVIGKGGSIIREIKSHSATQITIAAAEPTNLNDRIVSITGSSHGIMAAIALIRERVEAYTPPPADR
jgi:transcription antitermination factor NusA-like protein